MKTKERPASGELSRRAVDLLIADILLVWAVPADEEDE